MSNCIPLVVPAPKFGGGKTEVLLAGKIRLFCKTQYLIDLGSHSPTAVYLTLLYLSFC